MPVIGISVERLMALTRRGLQPSEDISDSRVEELLDQLGCDVDAVIDVRRLRSRHSDYVLELKPQEAIPLTDPNSGFSAARWEDVWRLDSTERQVLLELLPVRPDIFDAGGLARALRGYLGIETGLKDYELGSAEAQWTVRVDPRIVDPRYGRPHILGAVIRNLQLDEDLLRAIMKLQENIHWALCRDRKFASIGTYDLARLQAPIHYTLVDPDEFRFTPLFWSGREPVSPRQMLAAHPKGQAYAHLLAGLDAFPALLDARGRVLALPPVINAEETKVTVETRDLFVDVTGPSMAVVEKAMAIMATSLVELDLHGEARIEQVRIVRPEGDCLSPVLQCENFGLSPGRAARLLGLNLTAEDCVALLQRMRHGAEFSGAVDSDGPRISVTVPAYRTDILHEVDLIEDIAIAYGYHRILPELVPTFTAGQSDRLTELSRTAAAVLCGLGYTETISLVLTNERNHYERLRSELNPRRVQLANPASSDQTMLREQLLSSLLEQLAHNTSNPLPQRIFEVGDVALPPETSEQETRELRVIAAACVGQGAGFAVGRSVMDSLLHELGYDGIRYEAVDHLAAISGRAAAIMLPAGSKFGPAAVLSGESLSAAGEDIHLGTVLEVHPEVLEQWKIGAPVVLLSLLLGVVNWD